MAISIDALPNALRGKHSTFTVSATADAFEVIESIEVIPVSLDSGITVEQNVISGVYNDIFKDYITFIEKGSTDKQSTPETVIGSGNVPEGKTIFKFIEDTRQFVNQYYDVTVTHSMGSHEERIAHIVENNIGSGGEWLAKYVKRNS